MGTMKATAKKPTSRLSRAERMDRTRDEIRRAALDLFEEKGFAGATIDEIVAAASIGRRTFFRYFSCKEAVLFSGGLSQEMSADFEAKLDAGIPPMQALFAAIQHDAGRSENPDELTVRRRRLRRTLLQEPSVAAFYREQVILMSGRITEMVRRHPEHAATPYLPELVGGFLQILTLEHLESGTTRHFSPDTELWRAALRALEESFGETADVRDVDASEVVS